MFHMAKLGAGRSVDTLGVYQTQSQFRRRHVGEGQKRAAARYQAQRTANADIPSGERYTRQQDRAHMRKMRKELRSSRKAFMMENKFPGGAAEVR